MDDIDLSGLSSGESVKLLKKAIEVLESIDTSIDFLAAAMTGMEPLDIELGQRAIGRLQRPFRPKGAPLDTKTGETEMRENIKISEALIEEIMEEEIKAMLEALPNPNKRDWSAVDRAEILASEREAEEAAAAQPRGYRGPPRTTRAVVGGLAGPAAGYAALQLAKSAGLAGLGTAGAAAGAAGLGGYGLARGALGRHGLDVLPGTSGQDLGPEDWRLATGPMPSLTGGTRDTPLSPEGPQKQIRPGEEGFVPGEITYRDRLEEIIEEEVRKLLEKTK